MNRSYSHFTLFSHDGQSIAARVSKYENRRRFSSIAVYSIENGAEKLITDYVKRLPGKPVWSGDDDFIFMNSSHTQYAIPGKSSSVNRTGEMVYFSDSNRIMKRTLDSEPATELVNAGNHILDSQVSPDGQKIAYQVYGGNLWVLDIENNEKIDLGVGEHPTWSADSQKLAYMITEDDGHQLTQSDIYVIDINGQGKVNLTNSKAKFEMHPDWSPNGKWIAYDTTEDGKIWMQEVK